MIDPYMALALALALLSLVVWTSGALAIGAVGGIALVLRLDDLRARTVGLPVRAAARREPDPHPTDPLPPTRSVTGPIQGHGEIYAYSEEGDPA